MFYFINYALIYLAYFTLACRWKLLFLISLMNNIWLFSFFKHYNSRFPGPGPRSSMQVTIFSQFIRLVFLFFFFTICVYFAVAMFMISKIRFGLIVGAPVFFCFF